MRLLLLGLLCLLADFQLAAADAKPAPQTNVTSELDSYAAELKARLAARRAPAGTPGAPAASATNVQPAPLPLPPASASPSRGPESAPQVAAPATNRPAAPVPAGVAPPVTGPAKSAIPTTNAAASIATNPVVSGAVSTNAISTNSSNTLDDTHRLAIGDRLSFRILEDEEEPKQLFVTDSGDLEVPYIGRFPATRRTCKELAAALKLELEKEYYYQATVIVAVDIMAKSRGRVYLVGPVRIPGPQEVPSDEVFTLSKAILRAGGFNDFADRKNVRITRKGGPDGAGDQTFTVNVAEILDKGKTELDVKLEPDDRIYIPERSIRF